MCVCILSLIDQFICYVYSLNTSVMCLSNAPNRSCLSFFQQSVFVYVLPIPIILLLLYMYLSLFTYVCYFASCPVFTDAKKILHLWSFPAIYPFFFSHVLPLLGPFNRVYFLKSLLSTTIHRVHSVMHKIPSFFFFFKIYLPFFLIRSSFLCHQFTSVYFFLSNHLYSLVCFMFFL